MTYKSMRIIGFLAWIATFLATAAAKDIYVAQASAGSDTGADVANAHSLAWLNTGANWGTSANTVSPGDTVHLCGTLNSTLTIQGSGTAGNPITILFELGAKFSKAAWGMGGAAAIYATNKSYVTIDGGTNGLIESTDNGTALGQQVACGGISGYGLSHITVQNLTIQKLYQRTSGSTTDYNRFGFPIDLTGSYITVQKCNLHDGDTMIAVGFGVGDTDATITGNTISKCNHGINVNLSSIPDGARCYPKNITISNNQINQDMSWSGVSGNHMDGIIWQDESHNSDNSDNRGETTNIYIYGNTFNLDTAVITTAAIFIDTYFDRQTRNIRIYNNLFTATNGGLWTNGFIVIASCTGGLVANNTCISDNQNVMWAGGGTDLIIENNLALYITCGISLGSASYWPVPFVCDYNVYYGIPPGSGAFIAPNNQHLLVSEWLALGYDVHSSLNLLPLLGVDYSLLAGDTVAKGKGANLSSYFSTDKNANPRPSSGAWDVGAFQSSGSPSAPKVPKGLHTVP